MKGHKICLKLILLFVVGTLVGYVMATSSTKTSDKATKHGSEKDAGMMMHEDDGHVHDKILELDASVAPTIEIEASEDSESGFNIELKTTQFTFSPENASKEHVDGEGHAHLYVDGKKVGRLYGNWVHVDNLAPGEHVIRVTLNTNDHRDLSVNNSLVEDSVTVIVK